MIAMVLRSTDGRSVHRVLLVPEEMRAEVAAADVVAAGYAQDLVEVEVESCVRAGDVIAAVERANGVERKGRTP